MEKGFTKAGLSHIVYYIRCNDYRRYICPLIFYLFPLLIVAGCGGEVIVPESLTGEWRTSAPGYADRYMRFTINGITYGTGDGGEVSHKITKIRSEQLGNKTIYTFHYIDEEGDKAFLSFTYQADTGGTIQLKNYKEEMIWKRAAP